MLQMQQMALVMQKQMRMQQQGEGTPSGTAAMPTLQQQQLQALQVSQHPCTISETGWMKSWLMSLQEAQFSLPQLHPVAIAGTTLRTHGAYRIAQHLALVAQGQGTIRKKVQRCCKPSLE